MKHFCDCREDDKLSEEVDFITTIANLKKFVKEAEKAMRNPALRNYRFRILKPLHNTGFERGFGQHEESLKCFIGEINLNRERLKKKETNVFELKLSDIFKAVEEARRKKCDKVNISAVSKFTEEEDSELMNICITEIENLTEKWLAATKEEAPVLSNEAGEIKKIGFTKTKFTPVDDETIEACCGLPNEDMREHLEMYHPHRDRKLLECPSCGRFYKALHPRHLLCKECYIAKVAP